MKRIFFLLGAIVLCSGLASADGHKLSCMDSQPNSAAETQLLLQAPSGAKRIGEHGLEVKYTGGVERFIDKPPYEPFGKGILWQYCGYDSVSKIHLVSKVEGDLFSGVIVFEADGKTLNAGHTVIVSPDKKQFLAVEQEDGKDGEDWTLYTITGKKLWSGYAGILYRIPGNNYDSVFAQFVNPEWDKDLNLTAQADCSDKKPKEKVILKNSGFDWNWTPKPHC